VKRKDRTRGRGKRKRARSKAQLGGKQGHETGPSGGGNVEVRTGRGEGDAGTGARAGRRAGGRERHRDVRQHS